MKLSWIYVTPSLATAMLALFFFLEAPRASTAVLLFGTGLMLGLSIVEIARSRRG
jgi:hypothetical protein